MCGGYTTHSHEVPEVTNPVKASTTTLKQGSSARRINPNELAKQVAALAVSSGKVTRTDSLNGTALTEYQLRRGDTRVVVQTANSPYGEGESATFVQVKRGRKTLLTGNGIGIGSRAEYDASFTPGSWTKPFRLVDLSQG